MPPTASRGNGALRETRARYWLRKNRELALLARHARCEAPRLVSDGDELLEAKQALRGQLLARHFLTRPQLTESNLTRELRVELGPGTLAYRYQRFDLTLERTPFVEQIYDLRWRKRIVSTGFLTSSGMAAVTLALSAIARHVPVGTPLVLPVDCYFETDRFARRYLDQLVVARAAAGECVRFVDSSTARDPTRLRASRVRGALAVVFDTTCYPADAPQIRRVVDACLEARVPCVLVRSHLKLDCLATEYGRLGSVVLIASRGADVEVLQRLKAFRGTMLDLASRMGGLFSPHAVFPPTHDRAFRLLNQARLRRIRRNNLTAAREIDRGRRPRGTSVRGYHHGMYFTLHPRDRAARDRWVEGLPALEAAGGLRVAPSFGHDIATMSGYWEEHERWVLRIALPDWDDLRRAAFSRALAAWLRAQG